jgi:hypothetical protein
MVSLSVGRAEIAASGHPRQQHGGEQRQRGQFVAAVAGDGRVERGDVVAGQVTGGDPDASPEGRTDRIEGQEPGKAHPGHAGDDPVGLAQNVKEPGEWDDQAAVPGEKLLCPGHAARREQHVPAEPGQ